MQVFGQGVNADGSLAGSRFQLSETNEADETTPERQENVARNPFAIFAAGTVQHFFEADAPGLTDPDTGVESGHFEIFLRRASSLTATVLADIPERAESSDGAIRSDIPEPLEFSYVVTNDGPDTLVNNSVWLNLTEEMVFEISGCDSFDPATNVCTIPDIATGGSHTVNISLPTDNIEIGDNQATIFSLTFHSDTAVLKYEDPETERIDDYDESVTVATKLFIEGGQGAMLPLLPLLLGIFGFAALRRRG